MISRMANDDPSAVPLSREELVTMVGRAHHDSAYGESTLAGKTLAAQSKLPKLIAENLGAGFGQWDFFPEASDIVDFACAYVPPSTVEEVWALARAWAEDDAASRHTILALVGREILIHELRRVDVPQLRELFEEKRSTRALTLRTTLGLAVPAAAPEKPKRKPATPGGPGATKAAPKAKFEIPARMPKPVFVPPPKREPPPPPKKFQHPKFGIGVLESQAGVGAEAKLTIKFEVGSKTLLAQFVTEVTT